MSDETKNKIKIANTGKKASPETRLKMSVARRGNKHHLYGKTHSQETLDKMSKSMKGKHSGKNNPRFDEQKYRFMNINTGQVEYITKFDFYTKYGLDKSNIGKLINNKINIVKGWKLIK